MKTFSDRVFFFSQTFHGALIPKIKGGSNEDGGGRQVLPGYLFDIARGWCEWQRVPPPVTKRENIFKKKSPTDAVAKIKELKKPKRNQPQKTRPWIERKKKEYIFLENELPVVNWCGCLFLKNLCALAVENVQNRTGHILNIYMLRYLPSPRLYANK